MAKTQVIGQLFGKRRGDFTNNSSSWCTNKSSKISDYLCLFFSSLSKTREGFQYHLKRDGVVGWWVVEIRRRWLRATCTLPSEFSGRCSLSLSVCVQSYVLIFDRVKSESPLNRPVFSSAQLTYFCTQRTIQFLTKNPFFFSVCL